MPTQSSRSALSIAHTFARSTWYGLHYSVYCFPSIRGDPRRAPQRKLNLQSALRRHLATYRRPPVSNPKAVNYTTWYGTPCLAASRRQVRWLVDALTTTMSCLSQRDRDRDGTSESVAHVVFDSATEDDVPPSDGIGGGGFHATGAFGTPRRLGGIPQVVPRRRSKNR